MTDLYDKERTLYREVSSRVERSLPGVEVLALELSGPARMTVFVDHPRGVDHELCERVTETLRDYLRQVRDRRLVSGHGAPVAGVVRTSSASSAERSPFERPTASGFVASSSARVSKRSVSTPAKATRSRSRTTRSCEET